MLMLRLVGEVTSLPLLISPGAIKLSVLSVGMVYVKA